MKKTLLKAFKKALDNQLPVVLAAVERGSKSPVEIKRYRDTANNMLVLTNAVKHPFSPISKKSLKSDAKETYKMSSEEISKLVTIASVKVKDKTIDYKTIPTIASDLSKAKKSSIYCVLSTQELPVKVNKQVLATAMDEFMAEAEDDETYEDNEEVMEDENSEDEGMEGDDEVIDDALDDAEMDETVEEDEDTTEESEFENTEEDDYSDDEGDEEVTEESEYEETMEDHEDEPSEDDVVEDEDDTYEGEEDESSEDVTDENINMEDDEDNSEEEAESDEGLEIPDSEQMSDEDMNDTSLATVAKLNLLESASDKFKQLHIVPASYDGQTQWYLMMDNKPVAYMKQENASEGIQEIFNDYNKFNNAFATSLSKADDKLTDDIIKDFGIKAIEIQVNAKDVVKQAVDKQVTAATQKVEAAKQDIEDNFKQCLSIAAVGLNKGFFKNSNHPLKASMLETLSNYGVRYPETMVDEVFANAGDDFSRCLIEKANELYTKTPESRNDLAEYVTEASYNKMSNDSVEAVAARSRLSDGNEVISSYFEDKQSETPAKKDRGSNLTDIRKSIQLGRKRPA